MSQVKITPKMEAQVETLLGRAPRGLQEVPVMSPGGDPMVIRVASLVDRKPFPTMYWLIDKDLCYRIDREEAGGLIQRLQAQVDADSVLQSAMVKDHAAHVKLRNSYLSDSIKAQLEALNFFDVLQTRGIGGIEDPVRIRCLHTWYAAHLVVGNIIGALLDDHWRASSVEGD
ncbi:MAG: hypothetical protein ACJAUG_001652 [Halioglobus sp.]|jgi:hypothetical protein